MTSFKRLFNSTESEANFPDTIKQQIYLCEDLMNSHKFIMHIKMSHLIIILLYICSSLSLVSQYLSLPDCYLKVLDCRHLWCRLLARSLSQPNMLRPHSLHPTLTTPTNPLRPLEWWPRPLSNPFMLQHPQITARSSLHSSLCLTRGECCLPLSPPLSLVPLDHGATTQLQWLLDSYPH